MGSYESVSKKEVGEICDDYDIDIFTWIIPNASSLLEYSVGDFVKSPPLSCFGASWILKIYPCGQKKYESKEYIDIIIERVCSNFEMHRLHSKLYFRNKFGIKKFLQIGYSSAIFTPSSTTKKINSEEDSYRINLKEFYMEGLFELSDALILVLELMNFSNSSKTQDFDAESVQSIVGEVNAVNGNEGVGELFKEYVDFKNFTWQLWDMPSSQLPSNFEAQSPPFTFAKATWVLKIYPYYRMKPHNSSFDVALQRLHSEIEEHIVKYKIILEYPDRKVTEQAFIFNNGCTKGDAIRFELLPRLISDMGKMCFEIEMEMKKDVGIKFDSQPKLINLAVELVPQKEDLDDVINTLAAA